MGQVILPKTCQTAIPGKYAIKWRYISQLSKRCPDGQITAVSSFAPPWENIGYFPRQTGCGDVRPPLPNTVPVAVSTGGLPDSPSDTSRYRRCVRVTTLRTRDPVLGRPIEI